MMQRGFTAELVRPLDRNHLATDGAKEKGVPAHIPLDFTAKASIAVGLAVSSTVAALPGPSRRACGGASIATGAVRRWRTRPWPPGQPANKQGRRQQQRSMQGSSTSQSTIGSANQNVAIRGHSHARQQPGSIKQGQRQQRLTVQLFTTNPGRCAHVHDPLPDAPMRGRAM